jgi:thiol:disulfide interchange protein DsbD
MSAATFSDTISTVLAATDIFALQLLLAAALGLLLSLTPCIYPMIPITIGILQANKSDSIWHNASRALAYTCGIATTFALLGLASAFTGTLFGSLMASPWVIIPMVCLLAYLAGAMLGLYEMYIPRFFQQQNNNQSGSLIAAFSFGAVSGTVASPCLSPGLVLLLSIVSRTGNPFTGFGLLFAFGIGLSIPLLIIGTFSGSLHILPRAGMWMVYVKQIFGLLMIGIILYLLKPLVSPTLLRIFAIQSFAATGILLLLKHYTTYRHITINGETLIAIASIIIGGLFLLFPFTPAHRDGVRISWCTSYTDAHAQALAEKKHILLDVNAPYCTICSAIEGKFFCEDAVCSALGNCVPIQINGADTSIEAHEELKKKYNIIGAPTLILINPETGEEVARWGSELYDATIEEFVDQLNKK